MLLCVLEVLFLLYGAYIRSHSVKVAEEHRLHQVQRYRISSKLEPWASQQGSYLCASPRVPNPASVWVRACCVCVCVWISKSGVLICTFVVKREKKPWVTDKQVQHQR